MATNNIEVLSSTELHGATFKIATNYADFPLNPASGDLAIVGGILYFFTSIKGVTTWFPLTNEKTSLVHVQINPSTKWTISHDMNSNDFGVFAYDETGRLQIVQPTAVDENTIELNFSAPKRGRAVIFFESYSQVPMQITGLESQLQQISDQVNGIAQQALLINDFTTQVTTIQSDIDATESSVTTIETSLATIETSVTTLQTAVTTLQNTPPVVSEQYVDDRIAEVVGAAPAAMDTLAEIATILAENETAEAAVTNGITALQTALTALTARVTALETNKNTFTGNVSVAGDLSVTGEITGLTG
jgi:uncharacterized protein YoxC